MALANSLIGSTNTNIVVVPSGKQYAILTLMVCNTAAEDPTGSNLEIVGITPGSSDAEFILLPEDNLSADSEICLICFDKLFCIKLDVEMFPILSIN